MRELRTVSVSHAASVVGGYPWYRVHVGDQDVHVGQDVLLDGRQVRVTGIELRERDTGHMSIRVRESAPAPPPTQLSSPMCRRGPQTSS